MRNDNSNILALIKRSRLNPCVVRRLYLYRTGVGTVKRNRRRQAIKFSKPVLRERMFVEDLHPYHGVDVHPLQRNGFHVFFHGLRVLSTKGAVARDRSFVVNPSVRGRSTPKALNASGGQEYLVAVSRKATLAMCQVPRHVPFTLHYLPCLRIFGP